MVSNSLNGQRCEWRTDRHSEVKCHSSAEGHRHDGRHEGERTAASLQLGNVVKTIHLVISHDDIYQPF